METAVLYMSSSWDIHPGERRGVGGERIGNKVKSLRRPQRALLRAWVELGCSQGCSIYSKCSSPSARSFSPGKLGQGSGIGAEMRSQTLFTQNVYCRCSAQVSPHAVFLFLTVPEPGCSSAIGPRGCNILCAYMETCSGRW